MRLQEMISHPNEKKTNRVACLSRFFSFFFNCPWWLNWDHVTDIWDNVTDIWDNVTNIWDNVTDIWDNVTDIWDNRALTYPSHQHPI